jgi:hypothetical protein
MAHSSEAEPPQLPSQDEKEKVTNQQVEDAKISTDNELAVAQEGSETITAKTWIVIFVSHGPAPTLMPVSLTTTAPVLVGDLRSQLLASTNHGSDAGKDSYSIRRTVVIRLVW